MSVLDEISEAMGDTRQDPSSSLIRQSDVRRWMESRDVEALGALFTLLMNRSHYMRIDPPLSFDEYQSFVMNYYKRCIRENPDGEWADTRYSAGWSLVNWFKGLWYDSEVPRSALEQLKVWMAEMYLDGDEDVRTCLVTATLEHLFEERDIARYFADWRNDEELKKALDEALEWQKPEATRR